MKDDFFFYNKRNLLLEYEWNLHLNRLHFRFMDEHLLILNTISVGLNRHFLDDFDWNSFLNFNLHVFLFSNQFLHYFLYFYCFYLFLFHYYRTIHKDLDGNFNFLNDYLRHWNLNYLQYCLIHCDNLFNDLRNLNYFLYYSGHHNNLFDNFLDLHHPWHFHNLLDDSVDELWLNFYDFLLDDDWNWFFYMDRLNYFLPCRHDPDFLNLYLSDLFRNAGHVDLSNNWNLLSDIQWNYLFDFDIFCYKYLLDDRLVDKHFNLSYYFFHITFNEVGTLNVYFFWDLSNDFFFHLQFCENCLFNCIGYYYRSIPNL